MNLIYKLKTYFIGTINKHGGYIVTSVVKKFEAKINERNAMHNKHLTEKTIDAHSIKENNE